MSNIRIHSISIKNYRSFGPKEQFFKFPDNTYQKPTAIVGYNNCGKTTLMNAILYGLQINFISKETFSINDFHNRNIKNKPEIEIFTSSSTEQKYDGKDACLDGSHKLNIQTDGIEIEGAKVESFKNDGNQNWQAFGATRYFNIFTINFHKIKEEILTQKSSRGSIKSFLGKHIKKLIESDKVMRKNKSTFEDAIREATNNVFIGSQLDLFIKTIQNNYSHNLRENNCFVDFSLPKYEDIFSQMLFKIGLNGERDDLVPIDHFGDGYISMFVMAVIQAIAESNVDDKCLFLFEEPESFLHENHQEYFYKTVLCGLSKKGHQVIYTTHSDKMIDAFDTQGLIRLEMNENNETVNKYNDINENASLVEQKSYNQFIATIEPNLNKILFSKKVILVEGPNDVLVYNYTIKKKILDKISDRSDIEDKEQYAETYLNFHNISIICHFGKTTALRLIELCEHIKLNYFVINDFDFTTDFNVSDTIENIQTSTQRSEILIEKNYADKTPEKQIKLISTIKGMITNNRNLLNKANGKLHFNKPKLEQVIKYDSDDKDSVSIRNHLTNLDSSILLGEDLFPTALEEFLEINNIIMQN